MEVQSFALARLKFRLLKGVAIDSKSVPMFWDRLTYSADSSARRGCVIILAIRNGFDRQGYVAVPLLGETHYAGIAPGAYKLIIIECTFLAKFGDGLLEVFRDQQFVEHLK